MLLIPEAERHALIETAWRAAPDAPAPVTAPATGAVTEPPIPPWEPGSDGYSTYVKAKADELQLVADARREVARREQEAAGVTPRNLDDEFLTLDQLDQLPEPEPLIEGVLNRHTYAILRGRDGTYKTFVALDWSLCLATGKAWQGRPTKQVKVLYIAGEGVHGIAQRIKAWAATWGVKVDPQFFAVRRSAVNLFAGGPALDHLIKRIENGGYGLVVIDTLRRASGGADGNGSDMGVVIDNLDRVKRATVNGSVLVPAHTDKGDNDTRGYSGIEDDADIVWHTKLGEAPGSLVLRNEKMKDGPTGEVVNLAAVKHHGSLILQSRREDDEVAAASNGDDGIVLGALREMFATTGASANDLIEVTRLSKDRVYRSRGRLEKAGLVRLKPRGNSSTMHLVDE